jgi:hypothetical protein
MADDATDLIMADAAVDATTEGRRGRRRRGKGERVLTHCENCGAALSGEWCGQCGQHAIDYRRSIWRVFVDALDSFLNWDTKFLSSVGVLLTKPWKLTNDFNAGKRARYVHPLRLYLLGSIAFFLMLKLIQFNTDDLIKLDASDRAEIATALGKLVGPESVLTAEQQARVESVRSRLNQGEGAISKEEKDDLQRVVREALASKMKDRFERGERERLRAALRAIPEIPKASEIKAKVDAEVAAELAKERATEAAAAAAPPPPAMIPSPPPGLDALPSPPADAESVPRAPRAPSAAKRDRPGIHFDDDGESKSPMGAWLENRIRSKVGEDGTKGTLFLHTLFSNIPTMMLCCIPLFALVLKVLYMRKRRFYVEHLVYALHIHTFVYVGVTVIVLLSLALAQWSDAARGLFATFAGLAMFVLVFLSIRRVYGEGWFFTTLKFLLGGFAYLVVLIVAVGATAFITLMLPE